MAVDPRFAGRQYPPTEVYEVGREKIRDFADAVGAAHPAHRDVGAARSLGYDDVVAPATFAVVIAQRAEQAYVADPEAGIDFSRVVHAEERFTHHRPIVSGDRLVTVLHVDAITERAGLSMVTTRAEILDEAGGAVSTVVSTLAVRGESA